MTGETTRHGGRPRAGPGDISRPAPRPGPSDGPGTILSLALVLGILLVAGCTSEDVPPYVASFSEEGGKPVVQQGSTDEGATTVFEFRLNGTNLTHLDFSLSWSDDSGDGCEDVFAMKVTPPDPNLDFQPSNLVEGTSPVEIGVDVHPLPENREGENRKALRGYLEDQTHTEGVGLWEVKITCRDAQPDCTDPDAPDSGNSWLLVINVLRFRGEIRMVE